MATLPLNEFRNFIDNQWCEGVRTFDNRNPVDNSLIGKVHEAGQAQVDAAVQAARGALQGPWGSMTAAQRIAILHKVAEGIESRFQEFVAAEIADTGKPYDLASHLDIPRGAANFRVFADLLKNVPNECFTMDTPDGGKAVNYAVRAPRGVIGVICPWNLPLLLMTWKVGPALACGNTVVVKPSEETPATATLLGEVMLEAGVPAGVYNVVHGFGENSAGAFLTAHPDVNGITFTGETGTGEVIMRAAAKGLRPVSLELGGKNAAVVFADADLEKAAAGVARSAFENSGQVCLGTERVYVQRPVFERFVAALKTKAESLRVGIPYERGVNMGPLISLGHREKVLGYYRQAVADGATVVTGGGVPEFNSELAEGAWVQPTIWTDLPENSAVIREEIFGPCCHIAPFDEEDEVVRLVNDTPYGLAASVWTSNLQVAHRMGSVLNVGVCWINSWFLRDLRTAFGGAKQSGIGREGGVHSLEFYTELRNVCVRL
ncbi:2-hydroxymuconic semialdehyde dehydrogenase [Pseudomonas sp. IT-194MI4]|jgi:aminomuconate-semialdehyde/2-hydroxymuconate-6-semialdehyde dehydrogenase|uniref:2-hydroxymuconate semialdehyde dehydrogenase n=2 Tax=Pseudomonas TaxID=286 RepID=A0A1H0UN55_PSERE|nr:MULTISPECIES: 2-hydroxymuconic semialdehyde dehydrogenase [Pseudomonas]OLU05861.1 2-hydroxymuconic semialdehyde dehydrogenase [Pseudomonas reinekei]SDP67609.1 2-hydroxymuconate semialdehyde dehydrogenase [Pseudomonas reinekei]SDQ94415.1 2-hydroxymuconate semialdehyde dehydrogenase [Pseudomonas moorei]